MRTIQTPFIKALFGLLALSLIACATRPAPVPGGVTPLTDDEYATVIRNATTHTNQYAGIYQTFQADMTVLNSQVQTAGLRQKGYYLQWDDATFRREREKIMQENSAYAKFFLRFYSPEKDYDDLHKGKTIWRVYLDFNGQRVEGKVKKIFDKFIELQTIYPHFDRFSTPYEISFNVPMSTIEKLKTKVTMTSSLGAAQFEFNGIE